MPCLYSCAMEPLGARVAHWVKSVGWSPSKLHGEAESGQCRLAITQDHGGWAWASNLMLNYKRFPTEGCSQQWDQVNDGVADGPSRSDSSSNTDGMVHNSQQP